MIKCNVPNGWCPAYSKAHRANCHFVDQGYISDISLCSHRLRMNRLEHAQNKSILTSVNLDIQWEKEKGESR